MDQRKRIEAAYKILDQDSTSFEKFESARSLIQGINPHLDKLLESCSKELSKLQKLQKGEVIELSAEQLPEETEEEKKRKRILLLFIKNYKALRSEVKRMQKELENPEDKTSKEQWDTVSRIVAFAKGPFGIITAIAIIIVITVINRPQDKPQFQHPVIIAPTKTKTKVIVFNGKKIALSELIIGQGAECLTDREQALHYHAKDHTMATALDGSKVLDPGGCGFGKVKETSVIEE